MKGRLLPIMKQVTDITHSFYFYSSFLCPLSFSAHCHNSPHTDKFLENLSPTSDVVQFTKSINALCKSGDTNKAWDYFHSAISKRLPLNVVSFTVLLDSLGNDGDLHRIYLLLAEMGIHSDVITYTTLIRALCTSGRIEGALVFLDKMRISHCYPNVVTYSTLIDALCKKGRMDESLVLVAQVIQDGFLPDTLLYNALIYGLCKVGKEDGTLGLLTGMRRPHCFPDIVTYNILIEHFFNVKRINEVLSFVCKMIQDGYFLNQVTFSTVINGLCKNDKLNKALHCFQYMFRKGLQPNGVTYSSLMTGLCESNINGLCKNDKLNKALHCFQYMFRKGLQPNGVTYSSLMTGLCESNRVRKAFTLFSQMEGRGCPLNVVTYNIFDTCILQDRKREHGTSNAR